MRERKREPEGYGRMELLVSFDENYAGPFRTMLRSLVMNNPGEPGRIWLLHSALPEELLEELKGYCDTLGTELVPVKVDRSLFGGAPITDRYPQEMYYRMLAAQLLPEEAERVLYLDPDILVINPLRELWETDLQGKVFAAASHTGVTDLVNGINRVRLATDHDYYNSGVMLMDLKAARELVRAEDIFRCVTEHGDELLLPDQDVFNYLYGSDTLPLDDVLWNYDVRHASEYRIRTAGEADMSWVMEHTAILHFCGRRKPWKSKSANRFAVLYKHYMRLTERTGQDCMTGQTSGVRQMRPPGQTSGE